MSTDDDGIEHLDFEDPAIAAARAKAKAIGKRPKKRTVIPVLPETHIPIDEIRGNPNRRSRACVNLRIERVPWDEIVRLLEYESIEQARADYLRVIAAMHRPEEAETMRAATIANAETLLRRSMQMASADFLVDVENPDKKIPNRERLRWHQQAGQDLNLYATITGVKAPIKVEVTPTEEQYSILTAALLQARGIEPIIEAEVLELGELTDEPVEE